MIALLEGTVCAIQEQSIIVLANGVGFELFVCDAHAYAFHEKVTIQTYTHWNPDQGFSLYGFRHKEEQILFMLLISCQGIGPKMALTILKQPTYAIIQGILTKDAKALSSINGIGAKKAEGIILHLHDKVKGLVDKGVIESSHGNDHLHQLIQVLQSLNYSKQEISSIIDHFRNDQHSAQLPFDKLLKKALSLLTIHQKSI